MKTEICHKLGIETPIFAFSHCRDVVAAASKSGGFGVFGALRFTPEELEVELAWIDAHSEGKPYGVDVVLPSTYDKRADDPGVDLYSLIPQEHVRFFEELLEKEGVPALPPGEEERLKRRAASISWSAETARRHVEVALRHPQVKLIVNALGAPDRGVVDMLHDRGVLVGSVVGSPRHAEKQLNAGVDLLVAQGTEAAGHTGSISTLVLVPQVVDVAGDRAVVIAAGGITSGRQLVAMLALGAQGVWCGTLWLCTPESDARPDEKARLLAASSSDTLQTKYKTGKPVRSITGKIAELMLQPGVPAPLKAPLQKLLMVPFQARMARARRADLDGPAAGQSVGMVTDERSVRQIYLDMVNEAAEAVERVEKLAS